MSSDSVSKLKDQKSTVEEAMGNSEEKIAEAAEKVSRLRSASSSLETSLTSLRNIKGDIDDFEVTKAKWQGDEEERFESKHNSYAIYVNKYESDVSKAKEQIVKDLEAAKAEKATAETGLENLEGVLDGLDSDIKSAKED